MRVSNYPYRYDTTQAERRDVARASTYFGRVQQPTANVTGTTPAPSVPAQPATSPWFSDPVGTEPPLGVDVNSLGGGK